MSITELSKIIGDEVRLRRRQLGISQAQLAERAGVSKRLVVGLEGGEATQISLSRLVAIFDELGIQVEVSYDGEEAAAQEDPDDERLSPEIETSLDAYKERLAKSVRQFLSADAEKAGGQHGD